MKRRLAGAAVGKPDARACWCFFVRRRAVREMAAAAKSEVDQLEAEVEALEAQCKAAGIGDRKGSTTSRVIKVEVVSDL